MKIILASGSPRRKEILENAGFDFCVRVADVDEVLPDGISPHKAVLYLSKLKNSAVKCNDDEIVVSADTVVACDGEILGKPSDKSDAVRMLKMLSGRTHSVFTGVCINGNGKICNFFEETKVTFYPLSDAEIDDYVNTVEPLDKAGAYGIQGLGALFVKKIDGDYLNVVGLPLARLAREIKKISDS